MHRAADPDRVLAVDDDEMILDIVARRLARDGYVVETCGGGAEALDVASACLPGVIVSDLKMPGMDGLELLRELRGRFGCDVPAFVLMTAHADVESARRAISLGAYDYLEKPFSLDDLSAVVSRASDRVRLLRSREALAEIIAEDVRVPLAAVRANLEALEVGLAGPLSPEQRELVALSLAECARLYRLARNFDDARLLARRELYVGRAPIDLAEVAEQTIERVAPGAWRELEPVQTVADAAIIERIIENLVRAALEESAAVRVRVSRDADARIEVMPFDARLAGRRGLEIESRDALRADGIRANTELALTFAAAAAGALGGALAIEAREGAAMAVVRLPLGPPGATAGAAIDARMPAGAAAGAAHGDAGRGRRVGGDRA